MSGAAESLRERLAGSPADFPGALLLTGSSESLLEGESLRLAARLLCPGNDPEGECGSCRRVAAGIHPDLFTVEPEGAVQQIRIDRVREALAFAAGRPYEAPRRAARILRADRLGVESGNALLKALEEPGDRVRWILTTSRPELLPPTVRSRVVAAALPAPGPDARRAAWEARGFSAEDARDLDLFAAEEEADPQARLAEGRALRQTAVGALEEGLCRGRLTALLILSEVLAKEDARDARLLSELLADAALVSLEAPSDALRHAAVAGTLSAIARRAPAGALREAALAASDPPPDTRRGNRRMHFEKVLVELYLAVHPG